MFGNPEVALEAMSIHPLIRNAGNLEELYRDVLIENAKAIAGE